MTHSIRVSEELVQRARRSARAMHRSVTAQVEYWATIGQVAEDNPDLPYSVIKDVLLAMQESDEELTAYTFDGD